MWHLDDAWDKQVWNTAGVFVPRGSILFFAPLNVAGGTVADHGGKEDRVEPWKRAAEAGY